ncbi:MAG: GerMN domain-containing protein, partial [Clostridia bacterium]|nr:GerMN domain-containing protein [Clostridia bacterium]
LVLVLCLGGCTSVLDESRAMSELPEIKAGTTCPMSDEQVEETFSATLCYPDSGEDRLMRNTRVLTVGNGETRAQVLLNALLEGPQKGEKGQWPEIAGTTRARTEVSGDTVTVLLPARYRSLEPDVLFAVRYAIAETFLSLPETTYVNVLVGDREEGVDLAGSVPAGTFMHRSQERIGTVYAEYENIRTSGETFSEPVTLYMPSADGRFLLPVIRRVRFDNASPIEYMNSLLQELGKGADISGVSGNIPTPLRFLDEMPEIVRDHHGKDRVMTLFFSGELTAALAEAGVSQEIWIGMIAQTLLTFVPNVDGLEIYIGKKIVDQVTRESGDGDTLTIENGLIQRTHFAYLLGALVTGYRKNEPGTGLVAFPMAVPAGGGENAHTLLAALLDAPEAKDIMPEGVSGADVLAVRTERRCQVVNLSPAFLRGLQGMTDANRRLLVYAMVNTLTEGRKDQVIFFFGGAQAEPMDGLEMRGSFTRATGMIR